MKLMPETTNTSKKSPRKKRGNRKGFSTGANAAAAARAATVGLVTGKIPDIDSCSCNQLTFNAPGDHPMFKKTSHKLWKEG